MAPVKSAAMIAVAATTPGNGRPALERMTALTTRMYDMTRKLVSPPRTSVPIVEPASVTLKYESNQLRWAGIAVVRGAMQPSSIQLPHRRPKEASSEVPSRGLGAMLLGARHGA